MRLLTLTFLLSVSGLTSSAWAQKPLTAEGVGSYRVRFGLIDIASTNWDGSVEVSNGKLIQLRDWHPRPENSIESPNKWKLSTHKGLNYRYPAYLQPPTTGAVNYYWTPGVILDIDARPGTKVNISTAQGKFSFNTRDVPLSRPKQLLEGRVIVERVASSSPLASNDSENDFVSVLGSDNGEVWVAWIAYKSDANHVMARRFDGQSWGDPKEITEGPSDAYLVKMGRDKAGDPWFVWANQKAGNFELYGRALKGAPVGRRNPVEQQPATGHVSQSGD